MATEITGAQAASIFLFDPKDQQLALTHSSNLDDTDALCRVRLRLGEGVAGAVAQSREPLLIEDARRDSRFSPRMDQASGFVTRDLICAPILYKDSLLGVIQAVNATAKLRFDREDLLLLKHFSCLAAMSLERARLLAECLEKKKLEVQLQAAARIQSHFWPELPALGFGSRIHGLCQPAQFVGGDFYDCIPLPDDSVLVYVADVSGKGLPAALIMASAWASFRNAARTEDDVGRLLTILNAELYEFLSQDSRFITMICCRYWPETGRLQAAASGHPAPLLLPLGESPTLAIPPMLPVGVVPDAAYAWAETFLAPGHAVILYSDGATDARNADGESEEFEQLEAFFAAQPGPPWLPAWRERIQAFSAGAEQFDDITLLEIWRESA